MADLKYFKYSEFDSPDAPGSGQKYMNPAFVEMLDRIRDRCGFPLAVASGYRTQAHNAKVGGVAGSSHTQGVAADIVIPEPRDRNRMTFITAAMQEGIHRFGINRTTVHVDVSATAPRGVIWTYYK